MSMLSKNNSSNNMSTPSFHDFKKQASFFLKEKIKSARLALTDVTPAQLLTEEAANGNPWAPDTRILGSISKAAFELDDYWRIVEILHKRFLRFEKKNWRVSYNSIIVLEHLLTHGPESVAGEFQTDKDVIRQMETFQYIDEKGFNWGLTVRKKSERILKLLEKEHLLKEERDRARKLTRGIRGFGSFSQRNSSGEGVLQESSHSVFARSNSQFTDHRTSENHFFSSNEENVIQEEGNSGKGRHNLISDNNFSGDWMNEKPEVSCKENTTPKEEDLHRWNHIYEDNPLLEERKDEVTITEESHPFSAKEMETTSSLLSPRNGI
ncbi:epsin-3 isoform X1 [Euphorbia lathyris]|uniref:epsin-3 isoform X1 n=1 Tax=Euphorbia lathyris TaxID=212925 RepID=UPI0033142748